MLDSKIQKTLQTATEHEVNAWYYPGWLSSEILLNIIYIFNNLPQEKKLTKEC